MTNKGLIKESPRSAWIKLLCSLNKFINDTEGRDRGNEAGEVIMNYIDRTSKL